MEKLARDETRFDSCQNRFATDDARVFLSHVHNDPSFPRGETVWHVWWIGSIHRRVEINRFLDFESFNELHHFPLLFVNGVLRYW